MTTIITKLCYKLFLEPGPLFLGSAFLGRGLFPPVHASLHLAICPLFQSRLARLLLVCLVFVYDLHTLRPASCTTCPGVRVGVSVCLAASS